MSKIILNICDPDEYYVKSLSDYIFNNFKNKFIIRQYYSKEKLNEYLKNKTFRNNIFLIHESYLDLTKELDCLILSEKVSNEKIYKYSSGEKIVEYILDKVKKEYPYLYISDFNTKVIGIYSPIGGIGNTTFSLNLSKKFSQKTLFISLKQLPTLDIFLNQNKTLSDAFYYLLSDKDMFLEKLKTYKLFNYEKDFYYLKPFESILDSKYIKINKFEKFLYYIKEHSSIKKIVLSLPKEISENNLKYFELIDEFIFLASNEFLSIKKMNQFYSQMEKLNKEQLINQNENIIVFNKYNSLIGEKYEDKLKKYSLDTFKLPIIKKFIKEYNDKFFLNTDSEYNRNIKKIIKKINKEV
ncbi:MAG: hypothetical protein ACQEQE_04000 [Bacillota bacterium]